MKDIKVGLSIGVLYIGVLYLITTQIYPEVFFGCLLGAVFVKRGLLS